MPRACPRAMPCVRIRVATDSRDACPTPRAIVVAARPSVRSLQTTYYHASVRLERADQMLEAVPLAPVPTHARSHLGATHCLAFGPARVRMAGRAGGRSLRDRHRPVPSHGTACSIPHGSGPFPPTALAHSLPHGTGPLPPMVLARCLPHGTGPAGCGGRKRRGGSGGTGASGNALAPQAISGVAGVAAAADRADHEDDELHALALVLQVRKGQRGVCARTGGVAAAGAQGARHATRQCHEEYNPRSRGDATRRCHAAAACGRSTTRGTRSASSGCASSSKRGAPRLSLSVRVRVCLCAHARACASACACECLHACMSALCG